ncbi:PIR Superfamily Protein [Plasmodium ovale wallikeri]|uniref:PIR Superfamily Protein n=2 Tax=Plasmodium ovale TaxID=36330 RepID=A0A1A9AQL4_PLAOA|nr:PIR Superfamily Protein [Plasmodium ovale wallikeri]SBT59521.1 PIR Superfamily Protein [Plasmodium ovale wallikeri]SBT72892.1 Plasmodium vivax Vir protein, putative [Plasmodium ovale]
MSRDIYLLVDSPSYKFDKALNNVFKYCQFCSYCDEKKEYFYGNHGKKMLCYYFVHNLEKVYTEISSNAIIKDKRCNDVLFWLYDNLINVHDIRVQSTYEEIINEFKEVQKEIISKVSHITEDNFCGTSFKKILPFAECTKRKKLSDYCENYKFMESKLNEPDGYCGIYYHYLTKNTELYKTISSECTHNSDNNNCLSFKDCHSYDPQNLLGNDKCMIIEKSDASRRKMEKEEEQYTQCGPGYECVSKNFFDTSINYSDYRIVPLIVLSIWGTFLSLYFLYKLSPFRPWLNNLLHKKNIIKKNLHNEEFQELLESDSEDAHINFNNREYHITYNRE